MSKRPKESIYGPLIFNIFKPVGPTSADLVYHFKRNLPQGYGKIGHFGTLDPFAEGVLLIGIGGATRISDYVQRDCPKTYVATGLLGKSSPTGDTTCVDTDYTHDQDVDFSMLTEERVKDVLASLRGKYDQVPPHFSATKHQGKALYKWAREGVKIDKEAVSREIYTLELIDFSYPRLTFKVSVSTGTYIRVLFEDIAKGLGTLGVLDKLTRSSIGHLSMDKALREDHWPIRGDKFSMDEQGLKLPELLSLPHIHLNESEVLRYRNGMEIDFNQVAGAEEYWVFYGTILLGLGVLSGVRLRAKINMKPPKEENV